MLPGAVVSLLGSLTAGAACTVLRKALYSRPGVGLHETLHGFSKPVFTSLEASLAAAACLLLHLLHCLLRAAAERRQHAAATISAASRLGELGSLQAPLMEAGEAYKADAPTSNEAAQPARCRSQRVFVRTLLPALLGQAAMALQGIGLRHITASASCMVSACYVPFAALLAVVCLRRRLNWLQAAGALITAAGVATVVASQVLYALQFKDTWHRWRPHHMDTSTPVWHVALGCALTAAGQLLQACQLVAEEALLGGLPGIAPLQAAGCEGAAGLLWAAALLLPAAHLLKGGDVGGRLENGLDTWEMLSGNPGLLGDNAIFTAAHAAGALFGAAAAARLGVVLRALLLWARSGAVWGIELVLFRRSGGRGGHPLGPGEAWAMHCSCLQLAGWAACGVGVVLFAQGGSKAAFIVSHGPPPPPPPPPGMPAKLTHAWRRTGGVPRRVDDLGLFDTYALGPLPERLSLPPLRVTPDGSLHRERQKVLHGVSADLADCLRDQRVAHVAGGRALVAATLAHPCSWLQPRAAPLPRLPRPRRAGGGTAASGVLYAHGQATGYWAINSHLSTPSSSSPPSTIPSRAPGLEAVEGTPNGDDVPFPISLT